MVDVTQFSVRAGTKKESLWRKIRLRLKHPRPNKPPAELCESPGMVMLVAVAYAVSAFSTVVLLAGAMR